MIPYNRPKVGVGVILFNPKNDSIIMSKRKTGKCELALPGGHLEMFETIEQCSQREIQEETGINIKVENYKIFKVYNVIRKEQNYHYIDFLVAALVTDNDKPLNLEADKHQDWDYVNHQQFQEAFNKGQLFAALQELMEEYKSASIVYKEIKSFLEQHKQ